MGSPGDSVAKNLSAIAKDAGDMGSTPGLGRSFRIGNGNRLLENSMDRGAWQAAVHGVAKGQAQ